MPDILKGYEMVISEKLKDAICDMILDLDSHFPEDELNDEYYKWFLHRYIEPIFKALTDITD